MENQSTSRTLLVNTAAIVLSAVSAVVAVSTDGFWKQWLSLCYLPLYLCFLVIPQLHSLKHATLLRLRIAVVGAFVLAFFIQYNLPAPLSVTSEIRTST